MALNINGTTGISGVDGSASAASVAGTDANTGLSFASDTVNINTGGSTRVTVDSAGSVGIGTSTPTSSFSNADDLVIGDGSGNRGMTILAGTSGISGIEFSDGTGSDATKTAGGIRYYHSSDYMRFNTGGGTERMRINSAGIDVSGGVIVHSNGIANVVDIEQQTDGNYTGIRIRNFYTGAAKNMIVFLDNFGNVDGSIVINNSTTTYNTSSDYRLKENEVLISNGIERLKQLKPYRFNWKRNPSITLDGFFAHEAATVVPEAVTGTKDAVVTQTMINAGEYTADKLDQEIHQGIDQSKLVPLLTAALQEAIAKIEVLETKVAALEAG